MSHIGIKIKQRREELGMSQEELALKLGYKSRSSINKIELGKADVSQSKILSFAKALNTSAAYLMDFDIGTDNELSVYVQDKEFKIFIDNERELDFIIRFSKMPSQYQELIIEYSCLLDKTMQVNLTKGSHHLPLVDNHN